MGETMVRVEDKTPRVVCVEDDETMIDLVKFMLNMKGFDVVGARSGQEALKLIPSTRPDLVLLDIMMPEMDGWEVYQQMKADDYMRTIPVIVVTAKAQPIDEVLARKIAKVDDYVTKPFTPRDLEARIQKVLVDSSRVAEQAPA
jgi:DNA-binding response OmpR family regulator